MFPQVPEDRGAKWFGQDRHDEDHLPRLKEIGQGFAIYGYNGRGIGPGTVFGRAIADFSNPAIGPRSPPSRDAGRT